MKEQIKPWFERFKENEAVYFKLSVEEKEMHLAKRKDDIGCRILYMHDDFNYFLRSSAWIKDYPQLLDNLNPLPQGYKVRFFKEEWDALANQKKQLSSDEERKDWEKAYGKLKRQEDNRLKCASRLAFSYVHSSLYCIAEHPYITYECHNEYLLDYCENRPSSALSQCEKYPEIRDYLKELWYNYPFEERERQQVLKENALQTTEQSAKQGKIKKSVEYGEI